jgi:hypothetical protein
MGASADPRLLISLAIHDQRSLRETSKGTSSRASKRDARRGVTLRQSDSAAIVAKQNSRYVNRAADGGQQLTLLRTTLEPIRPETRTISTGRRLFAGLACPLDSMSPLNSPLESKKGFIDDRDTRQRCFTHRSESTGFSG